MGFRWASHARRASLFVLPVVFALAGAGASAPALAAGSTIAELSPADAEQALSRLDEVVRSTGGLGFYRDKPTDRIVVIVPESGSSSFAVSLADPRLGVEVQTRNLEPGDIPEIKGRIRRLVTDVPGHGYAAVFDPRSGTVRLITSAPHESVAFVEQEFPGKVTYQYGHLTLTSRYNDVENHWGGAVMLNYAAGEFCTSGFGVLNSSGYDRMLTAAHCATLGTPLYSPYGTSFGTVTQRTGYPDNDFELVGSNTIGQGFKIYDGGMDSNSIVKVDGAQNPATFFPYYCWSGVGAPDGLGVYAPDDTRSLEQCEFEFSDLDASFCPEDEFGNPAYPGDGCADHTGYFSSDTNSWYPQGGDSGSPIYFKHTSPYVGVRGILIGTDTSLALANGFAMLWGRIQSQYSVTVKVAP
jgi:hypothetical protein